MFKTLLKVRIAALYSSVNQNRKKKAGGIGTKILMGVVILYLIGVFGILFGQMFHMMCEPFFTMGLGWLYFATAGIMSFFLCVMFTIFLTKSQLFEANDNQMLLAMPISPKYILGSRMAAILLTNYLYEAIIMLPAGIVYVMQQSADFQTIVIFVVIAVFMPFFAMAFSCLLGWLVAAISSRMRNKNLITVVFSIVFFALYMMFFTQMQNYINELVLHGEELASAIQKGAFPFYHMGLALAEQNILSLLWFLICCILSFGVVYWILAKNFIRIATANRGVAKIKYQEKKMKRSSVQSALIQKEFKRFISCPMYILNAAIGLIMMVAMGIFMLVKKEALLQLLGMAPEMTEYMGALAIAAICVTAATVYISAASISLEGKNLWLLRALPLRTSDIIFAKVKMHVLVCFPFIIISAIICRAAVWMSLLQTMLLWVIPTALTCLIALIGIVLNLHFPKLDWVSEAAVIKNSAASMITSIIGITIGILPAVLYAFVFAGKIGLDIYLIGCFVVVMLLCCAVTAYLKKNGEKLFGML